MTDDPQPAARELPESKIKTDVPHSARIWNYWLGGKDNYPVDREAGDQFRELFPAIVDGARAVRHFLARAVRHLAGDVGIRQFLDVGTGLPTVDNTHDIAQRVAPECRIVYVDNDPLVLAHARALLTSTREGVTDYVDADLRDPDAIVREASRTLDFKEPVGLILMGILGHISDFDEARSIVQRLLDALPSGSYLAHSDGTALNESIIEAIRQYNASGAIPYTLRTPGQLERFYDGLELLEPGVVPCPLWRPDLVEVGSLPEVDQYGGVGRKP